jgi:prolyl oligopeptidase
MKSLALTLASLALAPTSLFAVSPPPETPKQPVTDVMHGESITDDYRWLEGSSAPELKSPDAALDQKVRDWSLAQNRRTREYLDAIPARPALEARLSELFKTDSMSAPRVRGGREFFTRRRGTESNGVLFVRDATGAVERELLNINTLFPDGRTTLAETSISREGARVAFGLFKSGDENTTLRILDVATGKWLSDTLVGKAGGVSWMPGGEAFVYHKLADIKNPYSREIRFHRVGDDPSKDRLIFEQYKTGPLATTYGPGAHLDKSGRHLLLSYSTGTRNNDLWVCDFAHWLKTGELKRTVIAEGRDATFSGEIRGDRLYLHTTDGAIDGRLYKIDLAHTDRSQWKEIVTAPPGRVLSGFSLSKNHLALTWSVDALPSLELRDLDGKPVRDMSLPGIGTAGLATDDESDEAFLAYSSFNEPPSTYRVDLATDKRSLYFRPGYAVNPADYEVKRLFFKSKDGTRVPLFVAHRKGLKLDGDNPTILYGYGGFSAGQKPGFTGSIIPWLDAGGVFALAGLRGGNEYGEAWHKAGMLGNKQNVFDDFIGAAEFLVTEKYTTPAHLGIRGGSNGGLLTGAALTQRPDLFSAVIVGVPLLDMIRFPHFLMAKYWVPEYGDPAKAADFKWIKAYSPYHRITPGVKYPATLLEAGEKDTRVHPLHARKMAAKLQAETAGDPAKNPILLWVDFDSGHGMGKSFDMQVRDTADTYLFFAKNLGLKFGDVEKKVSATNPVATPNG